jgi:hypothetical protein
MTVPNFTGATHSAPVQASGATTVQPPRLRIRAQACSAAFRVKPVTRAR